MHAATATEQPSDSPRADARRAQIRAAAAECFRLHGFHGSSIAQISKRAGMSTGHIYHYAFTMIIGVFVLMTLWVTRA